MKIVRNPGPVPIPPPVTYDLLGLTADQMKVILTAVGGMAHLDKVAKVPVNTSFGVYNYLFENFRP